MLGVLKAHFVPVLPAITAAEDTRAVAHVPSRDVFARANPDGARVVRIDRYATDGVGVLVVEDRLPGGTAVNGFPDAAATHSDVPGALPLRVNRDVRDAPRHECRADAAKLETFKGIFIEAGFGFLLVSGGEYRRGGQCQKHGAKTQALHRNPLF